MVVAQVLMGLKLKRQLGQTAFFLGFSITVLFVVGLDDMTILISRYWFMMTRNSRSARQSVFQNMVDVKNMIKGSRRHHALFNLPGLNFLMDAMM